MLILPLLSAWPTKRPLQLIPVQPNRHRLCQQILLPNGVVGRRFPTQTILKLHRACHSNRSALFVHRTKYVHSLLITHANEDAVTFSFFNTTFKQERFGTPRQPIVTENTLGNTKQPARIHLFKHTQHALSLRGLGEFQYCWVITFFHLNQGFSPLVTPPRGPRKKQGVFATRSPHRPNSIGLSCIEITSVDEKAGIVHLLGVDLLDGTPVLDIKPCTSISYCPFFNCLYNVPLPYSPIIL